MVLVVCLFSALLIMILWWGLTDVKKAMEVISEQIKVKMDPAPEVLLKAHLIDSKEIITLEVYRGEETPYYYVGEGNYTAYVRIWQ